MNFYLKRNKKKTNIIFRLPLFFLLNSNLNVQRFFFGRPRLFSHFSSTLSQRSRYTWEWWLRKFVYSRPGVWAPLQDQVTRKGKWRGKRSLWSSGWHALALSSWLTISQQFHSPFNQQLFKFRTEVDLLYRMDELFAVEKAELLLIIEENKNYHLCYTLCQLAFQPLINFICFKISFIIILRVWRNILSMQVRKRQNAVDILDLRSHENLLDFSLQLIDITYLKNSGLKIR